MFRVISGLFRVVSGLFRSAPTPGDHALRWGDTLGRFAEGRTTKAHENAPRGLEDILGRSEDFVLWIAVHTPLQAEDGTPVIYAKDYPGYRVSGRLPAPPVPAIVPDCWLERCSCGRCTARSEPMGKGGKGAPTERRTTCSIRNLVAYQVRSGNYSVSDLLEVCLAALGVFSVVLGSSWCSARCVRFHVPEASDF